MTSLRRHWLPNPVLWGVLLAALVLRALIPAGFMPSSAQPFALEICRAGFPAILDVGDEHASTGHASSAEDCVFALAPLLGPAAHSVALAGVVPVADAPELRVVLPSISTRRFCISQPRAPPYFS